MHSLLHVIVMERLSACSWLKIFLIILGLTALVDTPAVYDGKAC